MADLEQIRRYMEMSTDALEEALATEFALTQGVDVSAALDPRELRSRLAKARVAFRDRVLAAIEKSKKQLHEVACKRLKYCHRRETAVEVVVIGLADAGIIEFTGIPIPITAVSVYIVKTKMLDPICRCREPVR